MATIQQLEERIKDLERNADRGQARPTGGGGGSNCPTVLVLPAIPTGGMREVFWTSVGAGTGDDQVWRAFAGQGAWTPTQFTSILSGTP